MISFFVCLLILIGGYFIYGKIVENTFAPDDRETPAVDVHRMRKRESYNAIISNNQHENSTYLISPNYITNE